MPRQSPAVRPSPTSMANSHSSSKSERSSVLSTGSSAPAPDSRLRAVTWHSPFPASSCKEARWSRSKENRPMCQSSLVSGMVVCNRMRIGLFIVWFSLQSGSRLRLASLWLESAGKGNRVGRRTYSDHRIGRLDAGNQRSRQEKQFVCGVTLCRGFGDRDRAQFDFLSTGRPRNRGVVDLITRLGHLQEQFELDGAATNPFADLIDKVVRSHLRDLLFSEELLAGDGQNLITTERDDPARVHKLERVHAEIRQGSVTDRRWLRGSHESLRGRMRAQELLDRRWMGSFRSARTEREQKVLELFRRGCGEAVEGMAHDVRLEPVREIEFQCDTTWTRTGVVVRDCRYPRCVGESDRHRDLGLLEVRCLAHRRCRSSCCERSFQYDALRGIGTRSGMDAEHTVEGVHDLLGHRFLTCGCLLSDSESRVDEGND